MVSDEVPVFRTDLYRGTAAYYDEFRVPYPVALIDGLCEQVGADGSGRLLDLACGPGTATFPLCGRFAEVWAVDQEPESIAFAERKGKELGVDNVRWLVGRAEDLEPDVPFDVVVIGTAFHRLDRRRVASLAARWLRPGGHLALLWSSTPLHGPGPWRQAMAQVVVDWIARQDAHDRIPANLERHMAELTNEQVLGDAGFELLGRTEVEHPYEWTPERLVGFVYSTSLLGMVADDREAFEADVRHRLLAVDPSGTYREMTRFACDLARTPSAPSAP